MIHVWRTRAWLAAALAAWRTRSRLVVSRPATPRDRVAWLGWLRRRLLPGVGRVVATGPAEIQHYHRLGLRGTGVALIPPGVRPRDQAEAPPAAGPERTILCVGPLERHKGFRDAIWAFDVLRRVAPDLRLVLAGTGPERPRLEEFIRNTRLGGWVRLACPAESLDELLRGAELVWVPSHADGGVHVALEAMAAGKPVVASRLPALAEVVEHGATGLLVPPGDKVALARQTRALLEDECRRRAMGAAGLRRALLLFPASGLVRRHAELYRELAA
jgi:glycosyltransferase involved in cell wall biosynthesis